MNSESKNQKLSEDFAGYCKAHPELRFWQALRNWSQNWVVLVANHINPETGQYEHEDTFYWEEKTRT